MDERGEELENEIAEQVSRIIREKVNVDRDILHFVKEDLHQLIEFAGEEENSYLLLVPIVTGGIKKALIKNGKIGVSKMTEILKQSEETLKIRYGKNVKG